MKTKTNIFVVLLLTAVFSFSACESFLTEKPMSSLSTDEFWNNEKEIEYWMNGVYKGIVSGLSGNLIYWGEARSDSYFPTLYASGMQYQKNALTPSIGTVDWSSLYSIIGSCNIALDKMEEMSDDLFTAIGREPFVAECRAIRALTYFWIMRLWGECPIVLHDWDQTYENKYFPRSSLAEVAKVIEEDIDKAIEYMEEYGERKKGIYYMNLGAVYTLKMDFLTWEGRYSEVPELYDKLMAYGNYELVSEPTQWKDIFRKPGETKENLFVLNWTEDYSNNAYSTYAQSIRFGVTNGGPVYFGKSIYNVMAQDTMDIRMWGVLPINSTASNNNLAKTYTGALVPSNAPVFGAGGSNNDIEHNHKFAMLGASYGYFTKETEWYYEPSLYRYADALLLYAEALNRLGDGQGALDIINDIRASRGSSLVFSINDYSTQLGNTRTSREKLIMDERQLEFHGEGRRWFDLRRMEWGYDVVDEHIQYLQYQSNEDVTGFGNRERMLFPIYQANLLNNPLLKQNPGY